MADDIGFECLSINGSTSYKTPVLDSLAKNGVNFKEHFHNLYAHRQELKL